MSAQYQSNGYQAVSDTEVQHLSTEELIRLYLPLARNVAMQVISRCPANVELDDLINVGVIGLMDAAERFNPMFGKPFRFYAELRIRGEILDELRNGDWVPRSTRKKIDVIERKRIELEREKGSKVSEGEVATALGIKLERLQRVSGKIQSGTFLSLEDLGGQDEEQKDLLEALKGEAPDPDAVLRTREVEQLLAEGIAELPPREKMMISLYYFQDLSLKEIGGILGVTESRVSQMHTKALSRLKKSAARLRQT